MITVTTHKKTFTFKGATRFKLDGYNLHISQGKTCIAAFHQGSWIAVIIGNKP